MVSNFRQTASIVAPWLRSTSASRSVAMISCGVCRFLFIEASRPLGPLDSHISWYIWRGSGQRVPQPSHKVRASYNQLRPLEKLQVEKRGWTLDVLQVVQSLGKLEFTLADVYAHAGALAKLHAQQRPRPRQNPPATAYPTRIVVLSEHRESKDLSFPPSPPRPRPRPPRLPRLRLLPPNVTGDMKSTPSC